MCVCVCVCVCEQHATGLAAHHKIKTKGKPKASSSLIRECIFNCLLNHVLLQWPFVVFIVAPLFRSLGALSALTASADTAPYDISSPWEHAWRLLACVLIEDTCFYWAHRLLHHKVIYSAVHKRHHAFVTPHPLASEHAHVFESVLSNLAPFYFGPLVVRLHGALPHHIQPIRMLQHAMRAHLFI
jgi:sterol desaturase/sphingolipid hydroxylase (fatty acid hydroxylase superfamily)